MFLLGLGIDHTHTHTHTHTHLLGVIQPLSRGGGDKIVCTLKNIDDGHVTSTFSEYTL